MRLRSVVTTALLGSVFGMAAAGDEQEVKFSDCPAAVRRTFQVEAKSAKIETVVKEEDDEEATYRAVAAVGGRTYAILVLKNGTLAEMKLAVADELTFDRCPAAVRATFLSEAFGEKVAAVDKGIKHGITTYRATVPHEGKSYEIAVAEDGTLMEKLLVIDDTEVSLAQCPAAVRAALRQHAKGGSIGSEIARSTVLGRHIFKAGFKVEDKLYMIEIAEDGLLISKSLDD